MSIVRFIGLFFCFSIVTLFFFSCTSRVIKRGNDVKTKDITSEAFVLIFKEHKFKKAKKLLISEKNNNPQNMAARKLLTNLYFLMGEYDDAEVEIKAVLKIEKEINSYLLLIAIYDIQDSKKDEYSQLVLYLYKNYPHNIFIKDIYLGYLYENNDFIHSKEIANEIINSDTSKEDQEIEAGQLQALEFLGIGRKHYNKVDIKKNARDILKSIQENEKDKLLQK